MRGKRALKLVVLAVVLVLGIRWLWRQIEIDRCLDAGRCWDTVKDACNLEGTEECRPGGAVQGR